jgi:hypothetical protein
MYNGWAIFECYLLTVLKVTVYNMHSIVEQHFIISIAHSKPGLVASYIFKQFCNLTNGTNI